MLSAMSTSENFSLNSQPRCSRSPFRSPTRSSYGSSIGDDDCKELLRDDSLSTFLNKQNDRFETSHNITRDYSNSVGQFDTKMTPNACDTVNSSDRGGLLGDQVAHFELESDISELLEELDLEDIPYDQSKPLEFDINVLKLNLSSWANMNLNDSSETNYRLLDEFCMRIAREKKRASRHLSGGGLLSDSSLSMFLNLKDGESKSSICRLQDGGCISMENIFDFDDLSYFSTEEDECKQSNFLNQISPSSPLTFDLAAHSELKESTKGNVTSAESTNPFNNIFLKDVLDSENEFSSTNPFTSPSFRSSLNELPSPSPKYENLSIPQQSFSQCSTRPASPVNSKTGPEEPCISNPFLLNQASPQSCLSMNVTQLVMNDGHAQQAPIPKTPNSFIFAVPVFPIIQNQIANSSTQTSDVSETHPPIQEPVYQNVTNHLKKFLQWNNHSEYDLQCLKTTMKDLRNSGWYYENVSWQESVVLLRNTEPGTFLIRDSSDPNFLFSLSVQTSRGPTSVRLHYVNRQFRLDAEEKLIPHMPSFNTVIELIDYYIENTVKNKFTNSPVKKTTKKNGKEKLQKSKEQVWIDAHGNVYSNILLVKPLYKKEHFSTLQHLTRLAINRHIKKSLNSQSRMNFRVTPVYESSPFQDSSFSACFDNFCPILNVDSLPLPITLTNYLKDYPYCH